MDWTSIGAVLTALGVGGAVGQWARSRWPERESLQAWTLEVLDRKERRDDAMFERLERELTEAESQIASMREAHERDRVEWKRLHDEQAEIIVELRATIAVLASKLEISAEVPRPPD